MTASVPTLTKAISPGTASTAVDWNHVRLRARRLAVQQTRDPDLADDLAQQSCVDAFLGQAGFRGDHAGSFSAWIGRIAANRVSQHQRRRQALICSLDALEERALPASLTLDPDEMLLSGEVQRLVRQAICTLPPASRQAFALYALDGLTYEEIAARLSVSVGAVKSRLHAARERLKQNRELAEYLLPTCALLLFCAIWIAGGQTRPRAGCVPAEEPFASKTHNCVATEWLELQADGRMPSRQRGIL